ARCRSGRLAARARPKEQRENRARARGKPQGRYDRMSLGHRGRASASLQASAWAKWGRRTHYTAGQALAKRVAFRSAKGDMLYGAKATPILDTCLACTGQESLYQQFLWENSIQNCGTPDDLPARSTA